MSYYAQKGRTAPRRSPSRSYGGKSKNQKQYIDPRRFVKKAKLVAQEVFVPVHKFGDFDVEQIIQTNLLASHLTVPTPIQDQTIPLGLSGKDVVGIANTGTGKTIAFAIPVLNAAIKDRRTKALIMAPTRELAQQIEAECQKIARGSGIRGALLIGGAAMAPQLRDLKAFPQIVIGTPGRIKDHMERRTLKVEQYNIVVLDEVDRMLDMGFINDMKEILSAMATPRQSFFFSATMNPRVSSLIEGFGNQPVSVSVKTAETSDQVEQDVIYSQGGQKIEQLHDVLIRQEVTKALIFDETKRRVDRLSKELHARGFKVDSIHGDKTQGQRKRALDNFKENRVTVLVATDVAARGIDVADITHVINYSTPQSYEDYVHRIGRAGRAGRQGFALTFIDG